ncbi:MAG TPA: hypothetical protein VFZ67_10040 [Nitrososphaera sp.]|jgi:hypothetical protein
MMKKICIILYALARQDERVLRSDRYPKLEGPDDFALHLASPRNRIKDSMIVEN